MTDRELYLDYVNNFLTVQGFADYYCMRHGDALALLVTERARDRANYDAQQGDTP